MSYGDNLDGFSMVPSKRGKYWGFLHRANGLHMKRNEQYLLCFRQLQADGVAFKDITKRLLNEAKDLGIYKKTVGPWCSGDSTGTLVPDYRPFPQLRAANVAWAVAMGNFLSWIARNWTSYTEPVVAAEKVKQPKVKATIVVDGKEYKVTIRGITEDAWDRYLATRPVEEGISDDAVERLISKNLDHFLTLVENVLDEEMEDGNDVSAYLERLQSIAIAQYGEVQ